MIQSITQNLKARHCRQCGSRMLLRERELCTFDAETGERETTIEQVYAEILKIERSWWRSSFDVLDHDTTEEILIESMDVRVKRTGREALRRAIAEVTKRA